MTLYNPSNPPTKEVQAGIQEYVQGGAARGARDYRDMIQCNGLNHAAHVRFTVPHDFSSVVEAYLIVYPTATQAAANWDIYSSYGGLGEPLNTHTESDLATTYDVTIADLYEVDISGILSNLSPGDDVAVRIQEATAGHNFDLLGMRMRYQ